MAPEKGIPLPAHLAATPKLEGWPEWMTEILQFNYSNGITALEIRERLEGLPMVPGMRDLLLYLRDQRHSRYDTIILSDANMCFIQWIVQKLEVTDCFVRMFSNPASVDDEGHLVIGRYHHQTDCKLVHTTHHKQELFWFWFFFKFCQEYSIPSIFHHGQECYTSLNQSINRSNRRLQVIQSTNQSITCYW